LASSRKIRALRRLWCAIAPIFLRDARILRTNRTAVRIRAGRNEPALSAIARYAREQGLTAREYAPRELFVPEVLRDTVS
jgi:molybdate-binding protein